MEHISPNRRVMSEPQVVPNDSDYGDSLYVDEQIVHSNHDIRSNEDIAMSATIDATESIPADHHGRTTSTTVDVTTSNIEQHGLEAHPEPILLQQMLDIISAMAKHASAIGMLLNEYHTCGQAPMVPQRFVKAFDTSLQMTCQGLWHDNSYSVQAARKLAISLLASSIIEFSPQKMWSPLHFEEMLTGAYLRLETVGLWFIMAAWVAAYDSKARNQAHDLPGPQELAQQGAACLDIVRKVRTTVTDIQIWLAYDLLRLNVALRGPKGMSHSFRYGREVLTLL